MGPEAWLTMAVLGLVVGLLVFTRVAPDVLLLGGLTLLMVLPVPGEGGWTMGVLDVSSALSGLANPGMVTVGVLFIVVAGLQQTGGLQWVTQRILGHPKTLIGAQLRLMAPVGLFSAFLNNTPVVAMMIPAVSEWAKSIRRSPSKFMIPLSYISILGGTCTLIGTSTNLVINGLIISETDMPGLRMFDITWIGLPCAVVGAVFLIVVGCRMLPDRRAAISTTDDPREYSVEMQVQPGSSLVGKTIEEAGLRHLPNMYLMEIDRNGHILPAVGSEQRLQAKDRLIFVGIVESVKDLQRFRGLTPVTDQVFKLDSPRHHRCLIEAVVSNACPLVGKTIRAGRFRTTYNAAVIAVARDGERIRAKIGDIVLRAGDTLLLEAHESFVRHMHNSRDFFLLSPVEDSTPLRYEKAGIALVILIGMVTAAATGWLSMLHASMLAAGLMILTRCCTIGAARRAVDWQVLLVIASAYGMGRALDNSGAAGSIAGTFLDIAGENPWLALVAVYLVTTLFTELITNNAAAVLVFPIAMATAGQLDVNPMPFLMAIMVAASASFATPLGYQTNLMVYGPGGYRFTDFAKIGIPMNFLMMLTTVSIAPLIWPF